MRKLLVALALFSLLVPATAMGKQWVCDGMTGPNATKIQDHVPDSRDNTSVAWGTESRLTISSNILYATHTSGELWVTMTAQDYTLPVTITAKVAVNSAQGAWSAIAFRWQNSADYFKAGLLANTGSLPGTGTAQIVSAVVNSSCAVGFNFSAGTFYPIKVILTSFDATLFVDSSGDTATTQRLKVTTTENGEYYRTVGYTYSKNTGGANGYVMDGFTVEDSTGDATPTPVPTSTPQDTATPTPTTEDTATPTPTPEDTATPTASPTITLTPVVWTLDDGFGTTPDWIPFSTLNTGPRGLTVTASGNTITMFAGDDTQAGNYRCYYSPSLTWNIFTLIFTITGLDINFGGSAPQGLSVAVRYEDASNYALVLFPTTPAGGAINIASASESVWAPTYEIPGGMIPAESDQIEIRISDDGQEFEAPGNTIAAYNAPRIRVYQNGTLVSDHSEWNYGSSPRRAGGYGLRVKSNTYQMMFSLTDMTVTGNEPTNTPTPTVTPTPSVRRFQHRQRRWPKWIRLPGSGDIRG